MIFHDLLSGILHLKQSYHACMTRSYGSERVNGIEQYKNHKHKIGLKLNFKCETMCEIGFCNAQKVSHVSS